jgi:acyl transferase domain-containing protein
LSKPQTRVLLLFSAKHPKALEKTAEKARAYIAAHDPEIGDVAYTLGLRREPHTHRSYAVATSDGLFELSQPVRATSQPRQIVWVFTGQGAQWPQMGKELLENEPLVRKRIDDLDNIIASTPNPPSWTIKCERAPAKNHFAEGPCTHSCLAAIMDSKETSRLHEAEISQPCLTALQIALVDLLHSWNIHPAAVVGHSSGETAAAYACGAISASDAILLAYHRGQITPILKSATRGGMAAVGLGRNDVESLLRDGVIIGCENSPASVTLSGEADALNETIGEIERRHPDVLVRGLRVECAYHSRSYARRQPR